MGVYGDLAGEGIAEYQGGPLHMVTGGDQRDGPDILPLEDHLPGIEGIFQGVAGNVLQEDLFLPFQFLEQVAFPDRRADPDEEEIAGRMLTVEPYPRIDPPTASAITRISRNEQSPLIMEMVLFIPIFFSCVPCGLML
jgi:hypothetical protein